MGKPAAALETWRASEECIHCGSDVFQSGWGPNTFIQCDCCLDRGTHVGCHEKATGRALSREAFEAPNFQWFCCHGCQRISRALVEETGRREGASSEYTTELVRYTTLCRGSQAAVKTALDIFHKAFQPLVMDNGMDLIDMVCKSHEDDDAAEEPEEADRELYNFSNFRLFVLRKKGNIVTVATVRVFGTLFAEVPFVATREGYRREGNCRRLMRALDSLLHRLGVKWVILPAMKAVLHMWTRKFGYEQFSRAEVEVLEERVVMPDPDSAVLLRKKVLAPGAAAAAAGARRAGKAAAAAGEAAGRKVRFAEKPSYKEYSDSDEEGRKAGSGDDSDGGLGGEEEGEGSDGDSSAGEENEPLACGRCGAEGKRLKEDPESGILLCSGCLKGSATSKAQPPSCTKGAPKGAAETAAAGTSVTRDGSGRAFEGASGAAAGAGEAKGRAGVEEGDGTCCYNCGITAAVRWTKNSETGQDECHMCHNYRRKNDGKVRPPSAYRRSPIYRAWLKGGQQGASAAVAAAAAQRSQRQPRPALKPALRTAGSQPPPSHAAAIATGPLTPAALARRKRRFNPTLGAQLKRSKDLQSQSAARRELDTLMLDDQIARVLAGSVLNLVQQVDSGHAELLLDMEQRLGRLQLDKRGVEEAYAGLQAQHHAARKAQQAGAETTARAAEALRRRCEALEVQLEAAKAKADHHSSTCTSTLAALAQKDAQLAEKDAQLAQFQQLFQQLLAGAGALGEGPGTQAAADLAPQQPSAGCASGLPGLLGAIADAEAGAHGGAAEAAALGAGFSLVGAEALAPQEGGTLALRASTAQLPCTASQVTQQQQPLPPPPPQESQHQEPQYQQQDQEEQCMELVSCRSFLDEQPPSLAANASGSAARGAGEQPTALPAANQQPSEQQHRQEQQRREAEQLELQLGHGSQGVPGELGNLGMEFAEDAETPQPSSKAIGQEGGATGSRRGSGTKWSEEPFGMFALGLDSLEDGGADYQPSCVAEGVADSSQQLLQQPVQQQEREQQDPQQQERLDGQGVLAAMTEAGDAAAATAAPILVSSEVMDLDSDDEQGAGAEAGQRLAAILEQSMGSQESQLRPPPAAARGPSEGTTSSPLRSPVAGPMGLTSAPTSAVGAEAAIAELDTRVTLSPVERLQALVEESQSQGAGLPAPNDAAVALALNACQLGIGSRLC